MYSFFGLTPSDKENLILEPMFNLMYYMGFSYTEAMNLPVEYKHWFLERVVKEINKSSEGGEGTQSRAPHNNTPDMRALQNKSNPYAPARNRRFT